MKTHTCADKNYVLKSNTPIVSLKKQKNKTIPVQGQNKERTCVSKNDKR